MDNTLGGWCESPVKIEIRRFSATYLKPQQALFPPAGFSMSGDMGITKQQRHHRKVMDQYHIYLGGVCKNCGGTDQLEIDHIDPTTKLYNPATRKAPLESSIEELDKCQLLCHDCHVIKTNQTKPMAKTQRLDLIKSTTRHGVGAYRFGCRCEVCRDAHNTYMRAYKKQARLKD